MHLDLNRFRQLVPIDTIGDRLVEMLLPHVRVAPYARGTQLFDFGDVDPCTLFLMSGEVALDDSGGQQEIVKAGSPVARFALANFKPRRHRCTVTSDRAVLARVTTDMLDRVLSLATGHLAGQHDDDIMVDSHDALDSEWMMQMMQSPIFLKLPAGNIQQVFDRMEPVHVSAGDMIVRQGEPGDYFYVLKQGNARVSRHSGLTDSTLAILGPPESFGEEALLSEEPRNASVTMITDGILMRLAKEDFQVLLKEPLLERVDLSTASKLVRSGAVRIDVRSETEYAESGFESALNLPLYLLRMKLSRLDRNRKYVLYCDTGTRSTAAAFLMKQRGYDVALLDGGLSSIEP